MANTTQTESTVSVGRRAFMKLAAVGAGLSGATAGSVLITGRARATSTIEAEAHGGQISEITFDGDDAFDIEWADVNDRGTVTLELEAGIRGEDNSARIGQAQIDAPDASGESTVTIAAFDDEPGDRVPLVARHPSIDESDISVDLDDYELDSNQKLEPVEEKTIQLTVKAVHAATKSGRGPRGRARGRGAGNGGRPGETGPGNSGNNSPGNSGNNSPGNSGNNSPGNSGTNESEDQTHTVTVYDSETIETTLTIKPILGCGIQFGEKFAAWNEFGPEERVSVN